MEIVQRYYAKYLEIYNTNFRIICNTSSTTVHVWQHVGNKESGVYSRRKAKEEKN